MKKGVTILEDVAGSGPDVKPLFWYVISIRLHLSKGDLVKSPEKCLGATEFDHPKCVPPRVEDDGYYTSTIRHDRDFLRPGFRYALEGMKVNSYRKVQIAPHLAYGSEGIPGVIPQNALIIAEIRVFDEIGGL